ncbi:MAG: hypothetical protein R3B84_08970 [Zavarzinella sp.]
MSFQQPYRSPFELRWRMAGIEFRVTPTFWIIALLIAYFVIGRFHPALMAVDVACIFVSLVFGLLVRGLVYRSYGLRSVAVLQDLGSSVTPEAEPPFTIQRIVAALSTPAAAFALFMLVRITNKEFNWARSHPPYTVFAYIILYYVNLVWGILSLLPVFPMSGGVVIKEILTKFSPINGLRATFILSFLIGAAYCVYCIMVLTNNMERVMVTKDLPLPANLFAAFIFGFLAYQNLMILNHVNRQIKQIRSIRNDTEYIDKDDYR